MRPQTTLKIWKSIIPATVTSLILFCVPTLAHQTSKTDATDLTSTELKTFVSRICYSPSVLLPVCH